VDATIKALESFPANIHLILGGKDKGSDYSVLNALLRERVKRTHERLWFPTKPAPFFSTKAIRPGSESFAHFRPSGGRR